MFRHLQSHDDIYIYKRSLQFLGNALLGLSQIYFSSVLIKATSRSQGKIAQSPKEPIGIQIIRVGIIALKTGTPYLPRAGLVFPYFNL